MRAAAKPVQQPQHEIAAPHSCWSLSTRTVSSAQRSVPWSECEHSTAVGDGSRRREQASQRPSRILDLIIAQLARTCRCCRASVPRFDRRAGVGDEQTLRRHGWRFHTPSQLCAAKHATWFLRAAMAE